MDNKTTALIKNNNKNNKTEKTRTRINMNQKTLWFLFDFLSGFQ